VRSRRKVRPGAERNANQVPMPETKNSSASRHARGKSIAQESAWLVSALFTSQDMSGKKATEQW